MGFFGFLYYEGGGKYGKVVGRELFYCCPGGIGGKMFGDYCKVR